MTIMPMMVCCGRYVQAEDACGQLGIQLAQEGVHKVYLLCARHAQKTVLDRVIANLQACHIDYEAAEFTGYSCLSNAQQHADALQKSGCTFVVGIGGGKCMDTTKLVSKIAHVSMGMIPTQLATCASCAVVGVRYDDNGVYAGAFFPDEPPKFVLADLSVFANAPLRYLAAGIVDSMAKYPELQFNQRPTEDCTNLDDAAMQAAYEMSRKTWNVLVRNGRQAYADNRAQQITPVLSAVAHTNLIVTGAMSGLARGSKQLAIAHAFYNNSTFLFPEQWRAYLHGELVSVGLGAQMYMNDASETECQQLQSIADELGVPTKLRQLGISPTGETLDRICDSIASGFADFSEENHLKLRRSMEIIA